jgi:hypothetical protein
MRPAGGLLPLQHSELEFFTHRGCPRWVDTVEKTVLASGAKKIFVEMRLGNFDSRTRPPFLAMERDASDFFNSIGHKRT